MRTRAAPQGTAPSTARISRHLARNTELYAYLGEAVKRRATEKVVKSEGEELAKDVQVWHDGGMAIKNLLDDFKNAVLIAQAGINATVKSLKTTQSKAKKRTMRKRPPKKVPASGRTKPTAKRKRNPSKLVIKARAAVSRKPRTHKPARKSK